MSRNKKPASRRASSTKRKPASRRPAGDFSRFLKAFSASLVTAFSIVSCALNPQWRDDLAIEPILAQLGLPQAQPTAVPVVSAGAWAQTHFADCPEFFPEGGRPIVLSSPGLRELCFSAFAILHSGQTKTPVFVAQRLNRRMLVQARQVKRTDRFYAEARLPSAERAELRDYRNSGYARGHLAPAGDMHDERAMDQSFSLANMIPQDPIQNSGVWNRIEQDTRKYVMRARGDVHVFTGPVYVSRSDTIGEGRVAVPAYVYKVVHDASTGRSWVHWQPNDAGAKAAPPISYAEFVKRTGLHVLPQPGS